MKRVLENHFPKTRSCIQFINNLIKTHAESIVRKIQSESKLSPKYLRGCFLCSSKIPEDPNVSN